MTVITLPLLAGGVIAGFYFWPGVPHLEAQPTPPATHESLEASARTALMMYCSSCHTAGRSGADFDETTMQLSAMRRERATWELVVKKVRAHKMPPRGFPQPTEEDRDDIVRWIEKEVLADGPDSTGPLMARRLLRSEYQHAIQIGRASCRERV